MARYLSPGWFDEVSRQAEGAPTHTTTEPLVVLGQVVTGTPDGDVRYRVLVAPTGVRLVAGEGPEPAQVTFTTDWSTACAVASGDLSMQAALGAGKVRVGGEVGLLSLHQAALAGLDPVPASVRAATTWGDEDG